LQRLQFQKILDQFIHGKQGKGTGVAVFESTPVP